MSKSKKLIPILIILFIFGIYFVGKNIKFENNIFKTKQLAGLDDVVDPNLKECINSAVTSAGNDPNAVAELVCNGKSIYALDGINYLPNLVTLKLMNNNITNTNQIKNLSHLENLDLSNNLIKTFDFSALGLKNLVVDGNYVSDFGSAKIPNTIEKLSLTNNKIPGDIDLSSYTNLKSIYLNGNKITSLKLPSANIINLNIGGNKIEKLSDVVINGKSVADETAGIKNILKQADLSDIPFDSSTEQLIINNNSTLEELRLNSVGLTNTNFLKNQASGLGNLKTLTLSGNKLNIDGVDLRGLNLVGFTCDNCGLDQELNEKLNKTTIQYLTIPNNKYTAFHTATFPNLKTINIAGNLLTNFTNSNTNVTDIDISYNNLGGYFKYYISNESKPDGGIERLANVQRLRLRNINISGSLDLSPLVNLKELYLDNTMNQNSNNISTLKVDGAIEVIDVSNNAEFSDLLRVDAPEPPEGQPRIIVKLPSLKKLSMNFTALEEFKLYEENDQDPPQKILIYPSLQELNVIGCKGLTATDEKNDLDITLIKNQITKLSIALSGLGSTYIIPPSPSIRELVVDSSMPNTMYINKSSFPHLTSVRATSEEKKSILTSKNYISVDTIANLSPQFISSLDFEEVYGYFTDVDYRKVSSLSSSSDKAHFRAKQATITNLYDFVGHTGYDGYYTLNVVKISSEIFKFDDQNMIIYVGDIQEEEIMEKLQLSGEANAEIQDGKLVITNADSEVLGRYTISHTMPVDPLPGENDPIDPDDPNAGGHYSEDPYEDPENGGYNNPNGNYGTTENPKTGAIISLVVIVLLLISAIATAYYKKVKKNNEELIEKI